ncbi:glycosyltransferase [Sphingobacterium psychroaquaticum]|uniref:glycosyltransferase n=1 Tax=Sphingobacterium psychroaquaticum TaxID=561061 RepID=UPI00106C3391|nr:glycosyltransferase [Sphingobacterium psychroaquaticum]QBQ41604.1 glycosyltransferase [Sphingobacterium psychroaquaticum]
MFFSIIIPLYNRPQEIKELLDSLTLQVYTDFEVIIVEDGSTAPAADIVKSYQDRLDVHYYVKPNEGQGFARNYGFARAKGDFFIVFDSDILVPEDYLLQVVNGLKRDNWDAFGGPDAAHESFTPIQKAISYSMTSPFTTGGIRGNKKHVGQFHPRSFNMGISRAVYEQTKGFKLSRRSEDIEFSIRIIESGFRVGLIPEAFVYHKRRANFQQFYKQTNAFGKGRIDIFKLFPKELKPVHALPAVFVLGLVGLLLLVLINVATHGACIVVNSLASMGGLFLTLYTMGLFLHAWTTTKRLDVALLAVVAAYTQLIAYGTGFLTNAWEKIVLKR